ncbi:hypothetical protein F511_19220 [Dorcoceras hygrometricum]|uniref:Uncharacterized protein n=1 Tax=Dorcoceras hygrometricum TaxID=472368 RepID=A0A2Z7A9E1_9LAMI|nr:hypothetical protein F511_19220 [Dorcoceras hygrometricum]
MKSTHKTAIHKTCNISSHDMHEGAKEQSVIKANNSARNQWSLNTKHSQSASGNHRSMIFWCDNQPTITIQWSSGAMTQPSTTSTIALDLSGATTQPADHNASSIRAPIKFRLNISWYWKLAIAKRCRLNKSIRQRFAFALKIQQMACAMIKNQEIATVILNQLLQDSSRSVVELEKKPAVTIQQRRKFSSDTNSAATQIHLRRRLHLLHENSDFPTRNRILCTGNFTRENSKRSPTRTSRISRCNGQIEEMAPSAPRTRAAAALRMKQIALYNQDRTIRRLRAQLATERRGLAATKKELEETRVALEASHKAIAGLTEIGLSMSKKIEKMKVKQQLTKANHAECHQKFQARIHEAEDSMQAQHLLIEALVDEKDSLLQTIHGLQEANNAPAPFDGELEEEPEEEPEEEEIGDIPLGEGEIDDE